MYLDFYRLTSAPFPLTPDPTLFFVGPSHQAALDALTHGIAARQGLVVITGARGIGKTALVHAYLARVASPQLTTLVLWQARCSFMEILALLARHFAVPVATDDLGALRTHVQQCLWHEARAGRNVALIIDEAQDLPLETLEQVWELAHLPPAKECPLQIVLVGQPALQQHLQGKYLHPVAPRRGIHAALVPLPEAESVAYIRQHIAKRALPGGPIFTPGAIRALVRHAQGVPRDLNRLCTEVLEAGCAVQQQPITAGLVRQVLAASTGVKRFPLGRLGLAVTAGLVLAAGLLWVAPFQPRPQTIPSRPEAPAETEASRPTSAPPYVAPPLLPPGPAPQARDASPSGRALSPDPGEGDVRPGPVESPRREPPLATPSPRVTPPRPAGSTARVPAHPPGTPQQQPKRAALSPNTSDTTPAPQGEHTPTPDPPAPPPSAQGYTLMRRIYCEDLKSGVPQGSTDLRVMSPLSCEEAKQMLLVWEQQKDHCHFVNTALRESHHKAKEWIGTPSCPMP
jgi:general secretion pathway protein A